jgi:hypothetical protein
MHESTTVNELRLELIKQFVSLLILIEILKIRSLKYNLKFLDMFILKKLPALELKSNVIRLGFDEFPTKVILTSFCSSKLMLEFNI